MFIGGNGFRAAGAIQALEAAIERPVLTSNQVLLWQLLGSGSAVDGGPGGGWVGLTERLLKALTRLDEPSLADGR